MGVHNGQNFGGWNGNDSIDIETLFENASMFNRLKSPPFSYYLQWGNLKVSEFVTIIEQTFKYPDGKCFNIEIKINSDLNYILSSVPSLMLGFENANASVTVRITDPYREYFLSDVFTFSGKEITKNLHPQYENNADIYKVKIQENMDCEEDKEVKCQDYRNKETGSFKECVQSVVEERFLKGFGCMPPWFTENIEDMCNLQSFSFKTWTNISNDIFPTMDDTFLEVNIRYLYKGQFINLILGLQSTLQNNEY